MGSRFNQRDQKRKVNKIYNIAITIVSILIVIVAVSIFLSDDGTETKKATTEPKQVAETEKGKVVDKPSGKEEETDSEKEDAVGDSEATEEDAEKEDSKATEEDAEEKAEDDADPEKAGDAELVEVEGSGDGNVASTYTSESWKPVGTEQSGEHTTSFEKGSVDWNEMSKAIASGAGIDEGSMKLWWLQNGGSPTTAIGTVSEGDNPKTFRVYIEWVDGSGWKPVKVEELKTNDKR
ncbi:MULTISPECIES: YrrS family protein [Peribacillus]|uniref:YrrS family protein n=1 Tax=Peribacillus TaxID=2675229 RepID=UPI0007BFD2D2|nr:YrrS family protein [Peribacillus frigoritolerans]MEB2490461.1 YrrS family protein [Peribacillus frigoritolerans]MED3997640.1 YrrS family protein [Peribacillus frigoritolerans]WHY12544.1 YrrS family protein [Peribacillus frigoritolerans]